MGSLFLSVESTMNKTAQLSEKTAGFTQTRVLQRKDTISVNYRFMRREESHNSTVTVGVANQYPTFRKGEQALSLVTDTKERIKIFDDNNVVSFVKRKRQYRGHKFY
jgi:hypothetical protein